MAKKNTPAPEFDLYDLGPGQSTDNERVADEPPALPRTHLVTGNILHADSLSGNQPVLLTRGQSVTFGPEIDDDHIQSLIDAGVLDGPKAREVLRALAITEASEEMQGMTKDQLFDVWKGYLRQSRNAIVKVESAEARIKEDSNAARMANIEESAAADPLTRNPAALA